MKAPEEKSPIRLVPVLNKKEKRELDGLKRRTMGKAISLLGGLG